VSQPESKNVQRKQQVEGFECLPDSAFIRQKQLYNLRIVPFSPATLWRKVKDGSFPAPIRISSQIIAWRLGDIRLWLRDPVKWAQL
jgi:predicted DNA-binding transcriptional regulator AlpA